jgi:hypothetical protein
VSSSTIMAGNGFQAVGDIIQGNQTASMLNYQATIQKQNAQNALTAATLNANRQQMQTTRAIGGITAGYGASGVENNSGSVQAVLAASAANGEMDRQNILYGGQIRAINSENQASMDNYSANNALNAGYFNAVAGVLTAGGQMFAQSTGGAPNVNGTGGGSADAASSADDSMGGYGVDDAASGAAAGPGESMLSAAEF